MSNPEQELLRKIRELAEDRIAEVENFVDFLKARQDDEKLAREASKLSEPAFARVWDNDDDAIYDRV